MKFCPVSPPSHFLLSLPTPRGSLIRTPFHCVPLSIKLRFLSFSSSDPYTSPITLQPLFFQVLTSVHSFPGTSFLKGNERCLEKKNSVKNFWLCFETQTTVLKRGRTLYCHKFGSNCVGLTGFLFPQLTFPTFGRSCTLNFAYMYPQVHIHSHKEGPEEKDLLKLPPTWHRIDSSIKKGRSKVNTKRSGKALGMERREFRWVVSRLY